MLKTLTLAQRCAVLGTMKAMGGGGLFCHPVASRMISTSAQVAMPFEFMKGPKRWPRYNKKVFPPTGVDEPQRPAYVCHMTTNIKYSPDKLWWVACLVRGMTVDEAVKQLEYVNRKGAGYVKQTILEAVELAVQEHNVEFRSNLWVAESMSTKGIVVKGVRRHARKRMGMIEYKYSHYFVRLEEGPPPEHYYLPEPDGPTKLQKWIQERREQRIWGAL